MKRSDFFKRLGFGVVAAVVAPKAIASALEEVKKETVAVDIAKLESGLKQSPFVIIKDKYKVTGGIVHKGYHSPKELIELYDQTGDIYYRDDNESLDKDLFRTFVEK